MFLWLFNVYMDTVMKELKMGMGRMVLRFQEEGREWRLPCLLYADELVLCSESEEDLREMEGHFFEVCKRSMKVNTGKSKMMVLGGEEGLESKVCIDKSMSQNLNTWDVFWMNHIQMRQNIVGR